MVFVVLHKLIVKIRVNRLVREPATQPQLAGLVNVVEPAGVRLGVVREQTVILGAGSRQVELADLLTNKESTLGIKGTQSCLKVQSSPLRHFPLLKY